MTRAWRLRLVSPPEPVRCRRSRRVFRRLSSAGPEVPARLRVGPRACRRSASAAWTLDSASAIWAFISGAVSSTSSWPVLYVAAAIDQYALDIAAHLGVYGDAQEGQELAGQDRWSRDGFGDDRDEFDCLGHASSGTARSSAEITERVSKSHRSSGSRGPLDSATGTWWKPFLAKWRRSTAEWSAS